MCTHTDAYAHMSAEEHTPVQSETKEEKQQTYTCRYNEVVKRGLDQNAKAEKREEFSWYTLGVAK